MILGLYSKLFPNLSAYNDMFWEQIGNTLAMFFQSGIISLVLGLFIGVLLTIFKKDGIKQNRIVYTILSVVINLFRSIPFIILIIFLIPFTRAIVGTAIGVRGAIIPLVFGTVPFYSRQVETALDNERSSSTNNILTKSSPLLILKIYFYNLKLFYHKILKQRLKK